MSYFDCYLAPVRTEKLEAYRLFSERMAQVYRDHGAIRIVDCALDPSGSEGAELHAEGARGSLGTAPLRDFAVAADAREGETVVLAWTEWPSKAVRDEALPRVLADPRVQPVEGEDMIFEGRRLVAGGFLKLNDV